MSDNEENKITVSSLAFPVMQTMCKYFHIGYDQNHDVLDTCRHKANIPSGCSWGECSQDACPFLQYEEVDE